MDIIIIIIIIIIVLVCSYAPMAVTYFMTRENENKVIKMINQNKHEVWKVKEVICDYETCDERIMDLNKGREITLEIDNDFIVIKFSVTFHKEKYIIDGVDKIKIGTDIIYINKDLQNSLIVYTKRGSKPVKIILAL